MNNQRNLIVAVVLCMALLLGFDLVMGRLYPQPAPTAQVAAEADAPTQPAAVKHTREGGLTDPIEMAEEVKDLKTVLATPGRVAIEAPKVAGSINPVGARVDDITLTAHRQTVEKDSGPVRLFSPNGTPAQQFAQFGWIGQGVALPGPQTVWQVSGGPLAPGKPVTLTWDNGQGQRFTQRFTIDEFYMLTVEQTVANTGAGTVALRPYAFINRTSRTASQSSFNLHSGPISASDGSVNFKVSYGGCSSFSFVSRCVDLGELKRVPVAGKPAWLGFTDIFWLSVLVPEDGARVESGFQALGNELFRADVVYDPVTLTPGTQATRTTRLFAGAKESEVLNHYEKGGIENFGLAIDWGWFRWLMYPIFWLLKQIYAVTGNFGVAIMLLTVIVRGLMFPVAQKQFASMAQMRAVQPKLKALQERHKDDKVRLQQEMGKLYKDEGVNPLAGCLPIFLQIPIFFALYKTLLIAIEMRHKPFILWIHDLSAQDPAMILNLFGLLPFTPPSLLSIGVLAVLLGFTMWLQFKLNPAAMDPVQQQMFMIMPWVLMFVMAPFAAGLLIYWITSNVLTLGQQKYLYSKHPQLKAQADKDAADKSRASERDKAKG
ncbi:membrane protein insertase YidC [Altererythrobacter sp. Root672]|uniref:membrane protein insertase YidC n=1 Tax=Altererythrobacter sp. Root672 TaxID=1736584 RepID=UPI0006F3E001|nr:membrane protein insertase YidC [Altererythrobacter sp. Root672]KRA81295.1 preprotein translocase YidC [Altererythrobacter sp. Root672]